MPRNEKWLQQVHEEAIDPALPIVDAHHHLWFAASAPVLRTYDYLENDYVRDATSGHNILASVYVECRNMPHTSGPEHLWPVSETAWVDAIAGRRTRETPGPPVVAAAIVGFADHSGPESANRRMALARAQAAMHYLVEHGVAPNAIVVRSEGESAPLIPTSDGVREPQNRRVEIQLQ